MSEVYWAQYRYDAANATWQTLMEPTLGAASTVAAVNQHQLVLAGNGFTAYRDQFTLSPELMARAVEAVPGADAIASLALGELLAGRVVPADQAQPVYLRNKIALTSAERLALNARN
jgi:tRNA threonylcarbamoyladenosine biosynthesis protein TsaB